MARIQIIAIIINILFLGYVSYLIIKGRLREEYAIVWVGCTIVLVLFSFWRDGLDVVSNIFGIYDPPNLVFTASIFVVFIYLLHISVVNSKLQNNITRLAQELALLNEKLKRLENNNADENNK